MQYCKSPMSLEWDPGRLSMTTAALILLPKYKRLAIALVLSNFAFLLCIASQIGYDGGVCVSL